METNFADKLKALREKATEELDSNAYSHEKFGVDSAVSKFHALLTHHAEAIEELVRAAHQTIEENGHLADGDNCTLKALRDALVKFEVE